MTPPSPTKAEHVAAQAEDWLNQVAQAVRSDRRRDYGHPVDNCLRIAMNWNVYLEGKLPPNIQQGLAFDNASGPVPGEMHLAA